AVSRETHKDSLPGAPSADSAIFLSAPFSGEGERRLETSQLTTYCSRCGMPFAKQTEAEIAAEIKTFFPDYALANERAGGDARRLFEDFCKVGSLLTDEETCLYYLAWLNSLLVAEVERLVAERGVPDGRPDPLQSLNQKQMTDRADKAVKVSKSNGGFNTRTI